MSEDLVKKIFLSRRNFFQGAGGTLGSLYTLSVATGLPIPILNQISTAMAQGTPISNLKDKMFIMISSPGGIRQEDFSKPLERFPQFFSKNWQDSQKVTITHGANATFQYPPAMAPLAKYGNRMAVVVGMDTFSQSHPGGDKNSSTNVTAGGDGTSMHTLVGQQSGMVLTSVTFSGASAFVRNAGVGGQSPQGILSTLQNRAGLSAGVQQELLKFRESFHAEIYKNLSNENQKVIDGYWASNDGFKKSKEAAAALTNQPAPPNTLAGQLEMASRLFAAGIANTFMISDALEGNFDTHGNNQPQNTVGLRLATDIAGFLDKMTTARTIDNVNLIITSCFGRNPTFNGNGGDDHLPSNGHMTLFGPSFKPGVYGKTTNTRDTASGVVGWAVNAATGQLGDNAAPGGNFKALNAGNVLKAVGHAIGMSQASLNTAFPQADLLTFLKKG